MRSPDQFNEIERERRSVHHSALHRVFMALKDALEHQHYDDAILYALTGARILRKMIDRDIAISGEANMLAMLHSTVNDVLRLQNRLH